MSPANQSTNSVKTYFLPEWVTSVFYAGEWNDVEEGSLREDVQTSRGKMTLYIDAHTKEVVFVREPITGYRLRQREFKPSLVVIDDEFE